MDLFREMTTPEKILGLLEEFFPGDRRRQYLVAHLLMESAKAAVNTLASYDDVPGYTNLFGASFYIQRCTRKKYLYDSSPVWRAVRDQELIIADRRRRIEKILQTGGIDPQTGEELDPVPFEEQPYLQVKVLHIDLDPQESQ